MFKKVLVANRGEIACRIIDTLHKLSILSVAIYSKEDRHAKHVKMADQAFLISAADPLSSYLDIETIINLASKLKVDAIHPGYGFLSENANFAKSCEQAKISFIGPPSEVIEAMASKSRAKQLMQDAAIPVLPGYAGDNSFNKLKQQAKKIGFPLLIKAAKGGGGKGMRLVESIDDFKFALDACKREAIASFGDNEVILEKYITNPRHIEVQIILDNFDNILHLFTRDCSIQRRHQKIIEEAPAFSISEDITKQLVTVAIKVAKAINYRNVGTVEFIFDKDNNFYFLEMNTRLQVEHPVTEMITGLDLVDLQLKVAANQELNIKQNEIIINGHAIEVRVYAEDPNNNFLPTPGKIERILSPKLGENVRLDSGIINGEQVSAYYDPMLAKLIVKGDNRKTAIGKLLSALQQLHFVGIKSNLSFLRKVVSANLFQSGNYDTNSISKENCLLSDHLPIKEGLFLACIVYFWEQHFNHAKHASDEFSPWNDKNNWRCNYQTAFSMKLYYNNQEHLISLKEKNSNYLLSYKNKTYIINNVKFYPHTVKLTFYSQVLEAHYLVHNSLIYISVSGYDFNFYLPNLDAMETTIQHSKDGVIAPMPGTIKKILVKSGEAVLLSQPLIILEAMKMEHTLLAPHAGKISKILHKVGTTVRDQDLLVEMTS